MLIEKKVSKSEKCYLMHHSKHFINVKIGLFSQYTVQIEVIGISYDDLDDFEMLHITSSPFIWSAYQKYSTIFDSILFIRSFSSCRYLSPAFPVSSSRRKNRNIEVFGHCLILTVLPYLCTRSRRCSDGWRRCRAENGGMDRDKQGKRERQVDKRRNGRREKKKGILGVQEGWDGAHQWKKRIAREGREKRQVNEALLTF